MPSFSIRSKLPNRPLAALLPCFAILIPERASRMLAIVEVLILGNPEPPVPHMSMASGRFIFCDICFWRNLTVAASS